MLSGGYATGTLGSVIHSMLDKSRRELIMASIKSNAFMAWAFANNRVKYETGGANITTPITLGRNPNISSYQYYDPLPIAETDEFSTIRYGWSRVAGTVIVSDQEQDENTGAEAIFKILTEKMNVLEESIKELFSQYLYAAGTGTDPVGLASLIPDDPTTGSLGGLSRVTQTQWRTSAYQWSGGLDNTNIEEAFDDTLLDLKLKTDKPDLILCGRNLLRIYRQAARDRVVINISDTKNGKAMYDLGFEGVSHNGIPILYDESCGVNRAYFINSKYLRLHILKG
ncbi:MAG: phage major capsid protein, partial [Thermomicrobiales bacterium]